MANKVDSKIPELVLVSVVVAFQVEPFLARASSIYDLLECPSAHTLKWRKNLKAKLLKSIKT